MKHCKYFLIPLIILAVSPSCKKSFLDVEDNSAILRQFYVKDLTTAQNYLNGIYITLGTFHYGLSIIYPEVVADNVKPKGANFNLHYNWKQSPVENATSLNTFWKAGYLVVQSCNYVLAKSEEFRNENPQQADNIQAQALSLRAFVNFTMVNYFAQSFNFTADASHPGIPYVTNYDWTQPVTSRQTVGKIYEEMIKDLNHAIEMFPDNFTSTLYFNKNAAKALLARIYLFKEDYQSAKSVALDLAAKVPLLTIADGYPDNIYRNLDPSQTESLFQQSPSQTGVPMPSPSGDYTATYSINLAGRYIRGTPAQIQFLSTKDVAWLLTADPDDARKSWVSPVVNATTHDTTWNITKYPAGVVPGINPGSNSYYQTLLRSSEMYLTVAEASAKTGDENTAKEYLNAIRQRSNPAASSITASGPALLDSIYMERRKELAFEGIRMFDLLRWKKGVSRYDATNANAQNLPYPSNKAIAPIPAPDVDINHLQQNPGY